MFKEMALDGMWLLGSWAVVLMTGVIMSQKIKDFLSGVPAELRAAMKTAEGDAKARLSAAKAKVLADVMSAFKTAQTESSAKLTAALGSVESTAKADATAFAGKIESAAKGLVQPVDPKQVEPVALALAAVAAAAEPAKQA